MTRADRTIIIHPNDPRLDVVRARGAPYRLVWPAWPSRVEPWVELARATMRYKWAQKLFAKELATKQVACRTVIGAPTGRGEKLKEPRTVPKYEPKPEKPAKLKPKVDPDAKPALTFSLQTLTFEVKDHGQVFENVENF